MGNSSPGLDESAEQTPADSAIDRTLMAEERTFSAWLRTGLASLATGLAIAKLMPEAQPRWALVGLGIILVVMGAMSFLVGLASEIDQDTTLPLRGTTKPRLRSEPLR